MREFWCVLLSSLFLLTKLAVITKCAPYLRPSNEPLAGPMSLANPEKAWVTLETSSMKRQGLSQTLATVARVVGIVMGCEDHERITTRTSHLCIVEAFEGCEGVPRASSLGRVVRA
ncbi:hypothetical protein C8F01DRAFT_1143942 [Mycena amicta]|nr:hypothetical protein C8F01DRAFT_1143542 [Mycena amicta]KAJ7060077.1 hypothetical protein C8F01DRAFT_1143942 [Mycena amicta]